MSGSKLYKRIKEEPHGFSLNFIEIASVTT